MATTTNKQRLFTNLLAHLPKGAKGEPEAKPVLESFIYAICREGVTREQADRAYRNLQGQFFDWNEIRVSSARELADVIDELPDAESRGQRIIDFLQEVFETTFSFDLEGIQKKGVKQAAKQLSRYQAANDFTIAWVTQQSLGGHAIPLDGPSLRLLRRLGVIDGDQDDLETLRATIEHQVPKNKGAAFCDLLANLASEICREEEPRCNHCPMLSHCPTGQDFKAMHAGSHRKPR